MSRGLSTVLILFLMLVTLPIWVGLAGGLFGLIGGIFGAIFGMIGGIFGAIFGAIGAMFNAIFNGLFGWHHHWFPHIHFNGFATLAFVIVIALIISKRAKR